MPNTPVQNQEDDTPHLGDIRDLLSEMRLFEPRSKDLAGYELNRFVMKKKKMMIAFEKENYQYIALYHRQGDYWEMGDSSMLIYANGPAKILGRKVNIRMDDATDAVGAPISARKRWAFGRVSFSNLTSLDRGMTSLKYRRIISNTEFIVYALPTPIDRQTMMGYKYAQGHRMDRFLRLSGMMNKIPKIVNLAQEIDFQIVNGVANLSEPKRDCFGRRGTELSEKLCSGAIRAARGKQDLLEYYDSVPDIIEELFVWMVRVVKHNLFTPDQITTLAEHLNKFTDAVDAERKRELKAFSEESEASPFEDDLPVALANSVASSSETVVSDPSEVVESSTSGPSHMGEPSDNVAPFPPESDKNPKSDRITPADLMRVVKAKSIHMRIYGLKKHRRRSSPADPEKSHVAVLENSSPSAPEAPEAPHALSYAPEAPEASEAEDEL